jgi:kynureninase
VLQLHGAATVHLEVIEAFIIRGVIGSSRAPDIVRFGFAPLYLWICDVARATAILAEILETKVWQQDTYQTRGPIT